MGLRSLLCLSKENIQEKIISFFYDFQLSMDLTASETANFLEISESNYSEFLMGKKVLPLTKYHAFVNRFNLSLQSIIEGKVDYQAVLQHHVGNVEYIPKKYREGAYSAIFSLSNIIEVAKKFNKDNVIRKSLQISRSNLCNIEKVSIQAITDACEIISTSDDDIFYEIGRKNAFALIDHEFGKTLSDSKNAVEVYEKLLLVEEFVERNWKYRIRKMDRRKVIIDSLPAQELLELYNKKDYGSVLVNKVRAGFAATLPNYIGLSNALVTVTKSVHQGDGYCRFEIDLQDIKPLSYLH